MLFNSYQFLIFLPIVLLIYYFFPRKIKYIWLLITSYYFYMCWNPEYSLLLLASTVVTYLGGLSIEKEISIKWKKIILAIVLIANFGILFVFKYGNFAIHIVERLIHALGFTIKPVTLDILLPVGISFYIFQAIGYLIDVYRGKIKAEHNLAKYALFVSFFPQLVAGPIERSGHLLSQIEELGEKRLWSYEKILKGFVLATWGFFLKVVIADRISPLVDAVFETYTEHKLVVLCIGAVAFSIQIYCDFFGYSAIAIGVSKMMGIELMENFDTPYFSMSIKEFWNRWHISLSSWFRDYLYIPLGGNRCSKWKNYRNLLITFLLSGLWHGAAFHYVAWGMIHGIYLVLEKMFAGIGEKCVKLFNVNTKCASWRLFRYSTTFGLVTVAWIFFRAESIHDAIAYIWQMHYVAGAYSDLQSFLNEFFVIAKDKLIIVISLQLLLIVDILRKITKLTVDEFWYEQNYVFKMLSLILLLILIILWGAYGGGYDAAQFIYFQF